MKIEDSHKGEGEKKAQGKSEKEEEVNEQGRQVEEGRRVLYMRDLPLLPLPRPRGFLRGFWMFSSDELRSASKFNAENHMYTMW